MADWDDHLELTLNSGCLLLGIMAMCSLPCAVWIVTLITEIL